MKYKISTKIKTITSIIAISCASLAANSFAADTAKITHTHKHINQFICILDTHEKHDMTGTVGYLRNVN